jgi:hypothetical protein
VQRLSETPDEETMEEQFTRRVHIHGIHATCNSEEPGLTIETSVEQISASNLHHKPIRLYLCSTYLKNTDVSMSSPTRRGWVLRTETGYYGQPSSSAGISKQPAVTNR